MPDTQDITAWIANLGAGDQRAAQVIWDKYVGRLMRLAKARLAGVNARAADEEDVALSAMNSFFQAAQAGRFSQLTDSEELWRLLVTITVRKASAHRQRQMAQKRGAGHVCGDSIFAGQGRGEGFAQVADHAPPPDLIAEFSEQTEHLLSLLEDAPLLREVAVLKLEGYTNAELAEKLGRHERTIERKLRLIRKLWQNSLPDCEGDQEG